MDTKAPMTVERAVQDGADLFGEAEECARTIRRNMRELRKVLDVIHNAGHIGALELQALASRADAMATTFEAQIWEMHSALTKRAQELGIDLPQVRSGGPR